MVQASQSLHISQSALSQSITNLEKSIGYKLFDRSRRGTLPTKIGEKLIPAIIDIIDAQDNLLTEVNALKSDLTGSLKIATIPTLFHQIVPKALSKFKEDYPHIEVKVEENTHDNILKKLINKEIDIGLLAKRDGEIFKPSLLEYALNLSSDFKLIAPKKSKLSLQSSILLEQVSHYPFVLFDRNLYQQDFKKFEQQHGPLNFIFRTNNPSILIRTVSEGLGLGIISSLMMQDNPFVENDLIDVIPMGPPFNYFLYFKALTHYENANYKSVEKFIQYLKQ